MLNSLVAQTFRDIAQLLKVKGDNPFRIRAYEHAAQVIDTLAQDIKSLSQQGQLTTLPGIGKDLAAKIQEIVETGELKFYQDLKADIPETLLELLKVPSIGPKTAQLLYEKLHISSIDELEQAIHKNKLSQVAGIKAKSIDNIIKGIDIVRRSSQRMPLAFAQSLAAKFVTELSKLPHVEKLVCAGSLRRRKESVRDIDILAISRHPQELMDEFVSLPAVKKVQSHGPTRSSVLISNNIQLDCRVLEPKSFGAGLLYFTGSRDFNIKLRILAQKKGCKINEYGVFRGNKQVAGKTEEDIFAFLGMQYVEPEMREDTGEIALAGDFKLPRLVCLDDIKGDLHMHSRWSDGVDSIEDMANAARQRGYRYVAITDHSQSLRVAHGLSVADLVAKRKEIDKLNAKLKDFRVLYGTEVDIGADGSIDYPDNILKEFEIVIAAIHTGFKQSADKLTQRVLKACENKYVHIISHPTGRLWNSRDSYDIDLDKVFVRARETNTAMEINSFPDRMDLNDVNCRKAKDMGVKLSINTDSHATEQLGHIEFGLAMARRGWLEPKDVINTLGAEQLLKSIRKSYV